MTGVSWWWSKISKNLGWYYIYFYYSYKLNSDRGDIWVNKIKRAIKSDSSDFILFLGHFVWLV